MIISKQSLSDRLVIRGEPIAQGFAVGRIVHFQDILTRESTKRDLSAGQVDGELSRLKKAIDKAHVDLADLKTKVTYEIDAKHAAIFSAVAHRHLLPCLDGAADDSTYADTTNVAVVIERRNL